MNFIDFHPIYMTRVWGGRQLETIYNRTLPDPTLPYGESWELVDREEAQSYVKSGKYEGCSLHQLWNEHRSEIFGDYDLSLPSRFPLLIKILDAREDLSIQVHPPLPIAIQRKGEPKTEMWYIAECEKNALLYVGLKQGTTRESFQKGILNGSVAEQVHAIATQPGQSIFIPSGRLHAIGAGFLIHEIQQNSDTTYRVFDWNRLGLDGKPRTLHIQESLESIDFHDIEPVLNQSDAKVIADCEYFHTEQVLLEADHVIAPTANDFALVSITKGSLISPCGQSFPAGTWLLLPRGARGLKAQETSHILKVTLPH